MFVDFIKIVKNSQRRILDLNKFQRQKKWAISFLFYIKN